VETLIEEAMRLAESGEVTATADGEATPVVTVS
jgi:hypothetical protein